MFNINASEFLVILVVAMIVVGPQRLPEYAETLARWVRQLRDLAVGARETVRTELGPEFDDVDWSKFDPRQYDPRKIVRDALTEGWDDPPRGSAAERNDSASSSAARDDESTTARVAPSLLSAAGAAASQPTSPVDLVKPAPPHDEAEQPSMATPDAAAAATVPFDPEAT